MTTTAADSRILYVEAVGSRFFSGAVRAKSLEHAISMAKQFSRDAFHANVYDCAVSNIGTLIGQAFKGEWCAK